MQTVLRRLLLCGVSLLVLPMLMAGCGTLTHKSPDVGAVVVAPKPKVPAIPEVVRVTQPKPPGYFQQSLVDYFKGSPAKLTNSATPTPAAGPTLSK